MDKIQLILQWLQAQNITYELVKHPAVCTIEELDALNLDAKDCICKNLFLRDAKGKRHFLVCVSSEKTVDLKALGEKLGDVRLSFASADRLQKYLNLSKGAVTPLGILFDIDAVVEVVLDADLTQKNKVGVHPGENIATVFLAYADLERLIRENGNVLRIVKL